MFQLSPLNTQCRASQDVVHSDIIQRLRDTSVECPIDDELIDYLQEHTLKQNDFREDPTWGLAPVITTSNRERSNLILALAKITAKQLGVPVIRWKIPITGNLAKKYDGYELSLLYENEPSLWGIFVEGAQAYIKAENVSPPKGFANGSPVNFHSIVLSAKDNNAFLKEQISNTAPGEVIILPNPPIFINVRVHIANGKANETLVPGIVVIPLPVSSYGKRIEKVGTVGRWPSGLVSAKDHILEPGNSITYHKIQGRTMQKIILELNHRPFVPNITYNMLVVALSRVNTGKDMAIMKIPNGENGLEYLKKLKPDTQLITWLKGIDSKSGLWTEDICRKFLAESDLSIPVKKKQNIVAPNSTQLSKRSKHNSEAQHAQKPQHAMISGKIPVPKRSKLDEVKENTSTEVNFHISQPRRSVSVTKTALASNPKNVEDQPPIQTLPASIPDPKRSKPNEVKKNTSTEDNMNISQHKTSVSVKPGTLSSNPINAEEEAEPATQSLLGTREMRRREHIGVHLQNKSRLPCRLCARQECVVKYSGLPNQKSNDGQNLFGFPWRRNSCPIDVLASGLYYKWNDFDPASKSAFELHFHELNSIFQKMYNGTKNTSEAKYELENLIVNNCGNLKDLQHYENHGLFDVKNACEILLNTPTRSTPVFSHSVTSKTTCNTCKTSHIEQLNFNTFDLNTFALPNMMLVEEAFRLSCKNTTSLYRCTTCKQILVREYSNYIGANICIVSPYQTEDALGFDHVPNNIIIKGTSYILFAVFYFTPGHFVLMTKNRLTSEIFFNNGLRNSSKFIKTTFLNFPTKFNREGQEFIFNGCLYFKTINTV